MSREVPVSIDGPLGPLPAIVHHADGATRPRCCVIMLSAGQLGRVGPQRLYVNAARHWAASGICCVRLDLAGVGDSPVENEARHFDGHRPEEATAAVTYARQTLQAESIYVQGLCAGARVAFKCAARDQRVAGVLAWSCPVLSSSPGWPVSPYENRETLSDWSARETLGSVLRAALHLKILRPAWWRQRLRRGGPEMRQVLQAIRKISQGAYADDNPFLDAVEELQRGGRDFLFLFGQSDPMPLGEFRDRFPGIAKGARLAQGFHVIANGTHTFNAVDSQREVIAQSTQWLQERRSGAAASS
jgi:alpha/beta superfamily hydrolase